MKMLFLHRCEGAHQREGARHDYLVPVLDPETALACRESKGEIRGGDVLASRLERLFHIPNLSRATDNCAHNHRAT